MNREIGRRRVPVQRDSTATTAVIKFDSGHRLVLVELAGKALIGWSYTDETSRQERVRYARYFIEGLDHGLSLRSEARAA